MFNICLTKAQFAIVSGAVSVLKGAVYRPVQTASSPIINNPLRPASVACNWSQARRHKHISPRLTDPLSVMRLIDGCITSMAKELM